MNEIRNPPVRQFKLEFKNRADFLSFRREGYEITRTQEQYNQYTVSVTAERTSELLVSLKNYDVKFVSEIPDTLEKHFKKILFDKKEAEKNVQ